MTLNANSLATNLLVTAMVGLLVIVLPWVDRKVCGRLGISLHGGLSTNPRADKLLKIRQGILIAGLTVYLLIYFWLTFLSRSVMDGYAVHVAPLEDLKNAFETEHGFSDVIRRLFSEGFAVFANIRLVRPEDIAQFYMNMMVFVPLGYLLPYTFRWFRERVRTRPVGVCFLISFFTENMQLMSQRGLYDLDDMISNTLGGFIGQMLYIALAYVLTHPEWRKDLRSRQTWKKKGGKRALYPSRRRIYANCTFLRGNDREKVWDFYVRKLGYRPMPRIGSAAQEEDVLLLTLGKSRIRICCDGKPEEIPPQQLRLRVYGLTQIRQHLLEQGIDPGEFKEDPYTGQRELRFTGPDDVLITITEVE